ncbi:MAG TPA: family 20 glycosylhydrolase, partial [Phycisphaerae bacterium]|nr:family 20 glycosylhydrolase [Phycisphaerae bacterium]
MKTDRLPVIVMVLGLSVGFLTDLGVVRAEPPTAAVIPRPTSIEPLSGEFLLTDSTAIVVTDGNPEVRQIADYLATQARTGTGSPPPVREDEGGRGAEANAIVLGISTDASLGEEGYSLTIEPYKVSLIAAKPCGLFRGVQTIRQLLTRRAAGSKESPRDEWLLPSMRINDKPRYQWRGMLLDCGRHFMTKDFVKRYIDLLAYHKMNVLHWHLTEDQGWRIEIKKYPKLTEVGAWRGEGKDRYGGFYSQEDIREIVAYAKSRYVTIVPEIEMPGHSLAALASYPRFSCSGGPFKVGTLWGVNDDVYCAGNNGT